MDLLFRTKRGAQRDNAFLSTLGHLAISDDHQGDEETSLKVPKPQIKQQTIVPQKREDFMNKSNFS